MERELPCAELPGETLVIADLHLDAGRGADPQRFVDFIAALESARATTALVILGDLFEAWIGPAHAQLPGARAVLDALARFTRSGRALEFVPGNRDFLLGRDFELATGARVHAHGFVATVRGERTLFIHGDELCTLDRGYQRLKFVLRSRPIAFAAPRVPRFLALAVARRLRGASRRAIAAKPREHTAQQIDEVQRLLREHRASTLICGHAHRFRDETIPGSGPDSKSGSGRWIVLDAFGGARDLAQLGADGGWSFSSSAQRFAP